MVSKIQNKKFYHFVDYKIKMNEFLWQVGNSFVIDDKYDAFANHFLDDYPCLFFDMKNREDLLFEKVDEAVSGNLSKEDILKLAYYVKRYLNNAPIVMREYVLENIRKQEYPNLISRSHCLYLTDEASIPYWQERLSGERTLFEVAVSGNVFMSYAHLLPSMYSNVRNQEYQARCYWENKLEAHPSDFRDDKEYLFQGRVKVLRKI